VVPTKEVNSVHTRYSTIKAIGGFVKDLVKLIPAVITSSPDAGFSRVLTASPQSQLLEEMLISEFQKRHINATTVIIQTRRFHSKLFDVFFMLRQWEVQRLSQTSDFNTEKETISAHIDRYPSLGHGHGNQHNSV
jgi:hypothetical protein